MQQLPPVTPYIESAFQLARTRYGVEYRAWIDLSFRLAGGVSLFPLTANLQSIGDLDLLLRAMEDEHVVDATSARAQGLSHAYHYQMMFSETWVVACYEALRAIRQREREVVEETRAREPHHVPDGVSNLSTFELIFTDFELLRMPIAKYEIAKENRMKQPLIMRAYPPNNNATDDRVYDKDDPARSHIMPTGLSARGSVVWQVLDHHVPREYWVERRELADRLLIFKDEVEPAGLREARLAAEKAGSESPPEKL